MFPRGASYSAWISTGGNVSTMPIYDEFGSTHTMAPNEILFINSVDVAFPTTAGQVNILPGPNPNFSTGPFLSFTGSSTGSATWHSPTEGFGCSTGSAPVASTNCPAIIHLCISLTPQPSFNYPPVGSGTTQQSVNG
jgi:hypothetical protein